jgi:hypothetical protein
MKSSDVAEESPRTTQKVFGPKTGMVGFAAISCNKSGDSWRAKRSFAQ